MGKSIPKEIKVEILDDYIAVDNDENMALEARKAFGENAINIEPQLMSEDFSYYQKQVPGVFFLLGSRNEEEGFVNVSSFDTYYKNDTKYDNVYNIKNGSRPYQRRVARMQMHI